MNYIKNGAKVFFNYCISLVLFVIFIYIFMSITKDNFNKLLPIYCIIIFLITFALIYTDMKRLAIKEKKPQYELNPYAVKGLAYGALGFLPIVLLEVISVFIVFGNQTTDHIKHIIVNIFMGPLYFIIRFMNEKPLGYVLASLIIPLVAMLGYFAGYYGFDLGKLFKKTNGKPVKGSFTKSPWNPTNKVTVSSSAKKKKPKAKV